MRATVYLRTTIEITGEDFSEMDRLGLSAGVYMRQVVQESIPQPNAFDGLGYIRVTGIVADQDQELRDRIVLHANSQTERIDEDARALWRSLSEVLDHPSLEVARLMEDNDMDGPLQRAHAVLENTPQYRPEGTSQ